MKIKVLLAGSEAAPFAKVGGLGDVMGSLPRELRKFGVDAAAVIPKYESVRFPRNATVVCKNFPVPVGGKRESVTVYRVNAGAPFYFIKNKKYLSRGPVYYSRTAFAGSFREIARFLFFSRSVEALLASRALQADIVHCNDWHTGALAHSLRRNPGGPKVLFTIHNLANQGRWRAGDVRALFGDIGFHRYGADFNFMAEGIDHAHAVTTVSDSYRREITTKEYGAGLERLLEKRAREGALFGILNGIDYGLWHRRARRKTVFQKKLGLDRDPHAPIFGLVARLTYQKGIDLIIPLAGDMADAGAEFVFLGEGEPTNEAALKALMRRHPGRIYAKIGFDESLARDIYSQSDFFLMPSRFEPSGLGQLISMHYGTIPIVRATGGLKDTVKDGSTGFAFKEETSVALFRAMERALSLFAAPGKMEKISARCAAQDFSWKSSAEEYLALYRSLR